MSKHGQRYAGATATFALAAVWNIAGATSALVCLLAAILGFVLVSTGQLIGGNEDSAAPGRHRSSKAAGPRPRPQQRPRPLETHKDERVSTTPIEGAGYGW